MSQNVSKKRYSFRLSYNDQDIYDFIESSNINESETIRNLLRLAIQVIEKDKDKKEETKAYEKIKDELEKIKRQQDKAFQDILDKLNNGFVVKDAEHTDENDDKENKGRASDSLENSIESLLDSFG
jgi:RNA polymerase-interacting CarD/CdnL/TRCF family regulator